MITCTVKQLVAAIFLLQISLLSTSCRHNPEVRRALRLAGNNRGTFEKVLQYYSRYPADSLKLKAAIFLIGNMPGHYSYSDIQWQEEYYSEIEQAVNPLQTTVYNKKIIEEISAKYLENTKNALPDLQLLKSPHLIDHNGLAGWILLWAVGWFLWKSFLRCKNNIQVRMAVCCLLSVAVFAFFSYPLRYPFVLVIMILSIVLIIYCAEYQIKIPSSLIQRIKSEMYRITGEDDKSVGQDNVSEKLSPETVLSP